jgi:hypothetical protein
MLLASPAVNCYIYSYIKSGADALANLLNEQGGFPERVMWPKWQLNVRQPSSAKTEGGIFMSTKLDKPEIKPVFARLTPRMTREQIKQNLIVALEKSGFTIKPSVKHEYEGGQHD